VVAELRNVFRPEFLNRIEDIVVFKSLTPDDLITIVDIQIQQFEERLQGLKIRMTIADSAKKQLVAEGFDPVYGARPLKRVITKHLENAVSRMIVANELEEGDTLHIDYDREFRFERAEQ